MLDVKVFADNTWTVCATEGQARAVAKDMEEAFAESGWEAGDCEMLCVVGSSQWNVALKCGARIEKVPSMAVLGVQIATAENEGTSKTIVMKKAWNARWKAHVNIDNQALELKERFAILAVVVEAAVLHGAAGRDWRIDEVRAVDGAWFSIHASVVKNSPAFRNEAAQVAAYDKDREHGRIVSRLVRTTRAESGWVKMSVRIVRAALGWLMQQARWKADDERKAPFVAEVASCSGRGHGGKLRPALVKWLCRELGPDWCSRTAEPWSRSRLREMADKFVGSIVSTSDGGEGATAGARYAEADME